MKNIEPSFGYELDGYLYLGRGTGGGGWRRSKYFYYRCAICGDMMCGAMDDYFNCECKAMHLDIDAGRFGSDYGDRNILRYQKPDPEGVDCLMDLWPGACVEVIREFQDYNAQSFQVGFDLGAFKQFNCVPYHGGYTFSFENGELSFCDQVPENVGVFSHFQQYFRITGTRVVAPQAPTPEAKRSTRSQGTGASSPKSIDPGNSEPQAKVQKRAKIALWIASVLLLLASPALLAALAMSLAAPGGSLLSVMLFLIVTAIPYAAVGAGWIFYTKKNYRSADLCAKAPIALFLLFVIFSSASTLIGCALGFPTLTRTEFRR